MNKKSKRLFLLKNFKKTADREQCRENISSVNIVAEAERILDEYVGMRSCGRNGKLSKKEVVFLSVLMVIAFIISSSVLFLLFDKF